MNKCSIFFVGLFLILTGATQAASSSDKENLTFTRKTRLNHRSVNLTSTKTALNHHSVNQESTRKTASNHDSDNHRKLETAWKTETLNDYFVYIQFLRDNPQSEDARFQQNFHHACERFMQKRGIPRNKRLSEQISYQQNDSEQLGLDFAWRIHIVNDYVRYVLFLRSYPQSDSAFLQQEYQRKFDRSMKACGRAEDYWLREHLSKEATKYAFMKLAQKQSWEQGPVGLGTVASGSIW